MKKCVKECRKISITVNFTFRMTKNDCVEVSTALHKVAMQEKRPKFPSDVWFLERVSFISIKMATTRRWLAVFCGVLSNKRILHRNHA